MADLGVAALPTGTSDGSPTGGAPAGDAAANPAPFYTDLFSADGKMNHAALDRLPEDVRYLKDSVSKYDTAESFFRGIANQQTLAGKKGLIPLPANAPPEAIAERKALLDSINGVPKEAKLYGLKRPDAIPEDRWDQGYIDKVSDWAQSNSVSPAAMNDLLSKVAAPDIAAKIEAQQGQVTAFYTEQDGKFAAHVKAEGMTSDKADSLVERAATALGYNLEDPHDRAALRNATTRIAMLKHAIATGEDSFVSGQGDGKGTGGDALQQAQDILNNAANPLYAPFHDPQHPQHRQAVERTDQLFAAHTARQNQRRVG